ncbi:MAG: MFS transporter [Sphingomonadales bacterium]|nr:MFS transporter [Sphingomonadales bacterium]
MPSFALIMLGIWLMAADALVTSTIMPSVGADLEGYAWFGWATSGYLTGVVAAGACAGWLSSRIGLRIAMIGAGLLLAVGCMISALGPDIEIFVAGRVVQGLGAGWVAGFCYVTINLVFDTRFLVRVFAAATSVWGIATFVGPLIGGLFADAGNWRGVFWAFAAQAVLFSLAAARLVPRGDRRAGRGGVPVAQIALIAGGVSAIATAGVTDSMALRIILAPLGLAMLGLALAVDRRVADRLLPREAGDFRTLLGAAYATYFTMAAAAVGYAIYAPAILRYTNGLSALEAGYVVAIEALAWTLAALAVAGSGARWRRRWIVIGSLTVPAALTLLALVMASGDLMLIALGGALLGAAFGVSFAFISRTVMASLIEEERATGSGAIGAVRDAGSATGAAIVGIAASLTGFADGLTDASVAGAGFWVCAVGVPLGIVGAVAASRLVRLVPAGKA